MIIYSSLGIAKLPTHSNNHRKRLATQSRHVGRPDDSNVFIIKLPPNPHYYSQTTSFKGANELNSIDDKSKKVRFVFVHIHSISIENLIQHVCIECLALCVLLIVFPTNTFLSNELFEVSGTLNNKHCHGKVFIL